ncbi:4-hydroxy-3-methylbut-2-enyl diphosphate reductase [Desulfolithobacter dissulfuricans]|uniref:4-hydroxy-3-methylbut-2-enyl diphosphate reductase n=1 Tax=Desulfolithobacter dissulfuricans TaxID=2795293 RepID=A0A915U3T8_9BACT|nr:4-hydroxy-3-methylbut-2-enyl diphosphate reductase [Desulfolithobacter dissulfuricans]BCO10335.1 4-hydroxy-3-methylbut-2-enyl diphosphate reductase [Desulfolithobacter dissulfuricans]
MNVLLAKPRGFCAGVKRAIAIVEKALEIYGAPIYVLHEIVHNTTVVNTLREKGVVFVEQLEEAPGNSVLIFSAHGVARSVEERARKLGLRTINATCPLVTKVHRRVALLNKIGYDVLVIGHRGHPEVEGTCGRASGAVHVVSRPEDVAALTVADDNRVGYVTQTTLSMDDASEVLAAIRARFPKIDQPERTDICYATQNRQNAVRELCEEVDLLLVVGSKNSSNSNRLREVGEHRNITSHLIDNASEIDPAWLQGVTTIGVTAGASAPESLVNEVLDRLRDLGAISIREMEGEDETIQFQLGCPELDELEPGPAT